jgi:hypothetical protein
MSINLYETKIRIFSHYIIKCHYSRIKLYDFFKKLKLKTCINSKWSFFFSPKFYFKNFPYMRFH